MAKVIVIGGGPAGMMSAISAAKNHDVALLEGNDKLGKKMFITGKGRCNVTNARDISEFFEYIHGNPYFLYSAFYTFTNEDVINFFENAGTKLKVERGMRVFPASDKSSDVISSLNKELKKARVNVNLSSKVVKWGIENNTIKFVELENEKKIYGDHFILCTGGVSYPLTGSTGIGHELSLKAGHKIVDLKPSLVPIEVINEEVKDLQGLNLKNIEINIRERNKSKTLFKDFGEIMFTHYGMRGPLILKGSRYIDETKDYDIDIDLKPALDINELDKRIQKDFNKNLNKSFKNSLDELLPKQLIPVIIKLSKIDEDKQVNSITKEERKTLVKLIKALSFKVKGLRPISEAIVTAGGVSTSEIDPSTMKSKIVSNLSFAGEVIDVDAFTGGYNVQIALSTGYLAGSSI